MEDMRIPRKRHSAEEIVAKLRQVDVLAAQGRPVAEAIDRLDGSDRLAMAFGVWRAEGRLVKRDTRLHLAEFG